RGRRGSAVPLARGVPSARRPFHRTPPAGPGRPRIGLGAAVLSADRSESGAYTSFFGRAARCRGGVRAAPPPVRFVTRAGPSFQPEAGPARLAEASRRVRRAPTVASTVSFIADLRDDLAPRGCDPGRDAFGTLRFRDLQMTGHGRFSWRSRLGGPEAGMTTAQERKPYARPFQQGGMTPKSPARASSPSNPPRCSPT